MEFTSIREALTKGKGKVAIRGWVYRERKLSDKVFLVIRDSSNIIQCIISKDKPFWNEANKLLIESSVTLEGSLREDKRAPTGYEIDVEKLTIIHFSEKYPITKDQSIEFLADMRHLWLRSRKMTSILKIRSTVFGAIHEYFRKQGFYEYQSPIFQPTQSEGGSTVFKVNYFG
ncbi:asparagine--tRNA ligase, partial [Candidatus Woesearchaeota archaeon]|nr:asparagine--tRNA ligase [Candidatus Woesearchaeota archaeon]